MNFDGFIIGCLALFVIGVGHPMVIKGHYYFGKKIWIVFMLLGVISIACSLFVNNTILSVFLGFLGATFVWSIKETFEMEERVKKGWLPKNPKRKD